MRSNLVTAAVAVLATASGLTASLADEPAPIAVELNRLDPAGPDCRASMLVTNGTDGPLDTLKLELVVFDAAGIANRRLAAEFGPLSKGKTVLKVFPLGGIACEGVGRLLVNGVLACGTKAAPIADCVDRIAVSSRASVPLIK